MPYTEDNFPRTEFSDRVYRLLVNEPIKGMGIFSRRRAGKSHFLAKDLASLAKSKGHRVIYVNFRIQPNFPLQTLLLRFDQVLSGRPAFLGVGFDLDGMIVNFANMLPSHFMVMAPDGSAEVKVSTGKLKGKALEEHLRLLDQYCERFASEGKPAFLLLDEFQELKGSKNSGPIIERLRAALNKSEGGLIAVLTGSSENELKHAFTEGYDEPLLGLMAPIQLPPLGEGFVEHQLKKFRRNLGVKIDRETAVEIFDMFDRDPFFLEQWAMERMVYPKKSGIRAAQSVQKTLARKLDFARKWKPLSSSQRIIARAFVERAGQIHDKNRNDFIMELTGREPPLKEELQAAADELSELGIIGNWGEKWQLRDPIFERWLKSLPASEF